MITFALIFLAGAGFLKALEKWGYGALFLIVFILALLGFR